MPDHFVIDACSLLAFFQQEQGSTEVVNLFRNSQLQQDTIFLHKITATEVLDDLLRSDKTKVPKQLWNDIYRLPAIIVDKLSDSLLKMAAYFKITCKVSFADSFVLALASLQNAKVVTFGHHEFDVVEKSGALQLKWIR